MALFTSRCGTAHHQTMVLRKPCDGMYERCRSGFAAHSRARPARHLRCQAQPDCGINVSGFRARAFYQRDAVTCASGALRRRFAHVSTVAWLASIEWIVLRQIAWRVTHLCFP